MNIQTQIRSSLWQSIAKSYEAGSYKNAILDAIHFLTDVIREKADIEGDGVKMLGPAFGGTNPRIRINKLQTQSEKDAQAGLLKMLEGIYQGIRNPRSHEQFEDKRETADVIILFINYILGIIDASKGPFVLEDWLTRIFDPDFYPDPRYAKILVSEVPPKRYIDTCISLYRRKMDTNGDNLYFVFNEIISRIDEDNLTEIIDVVSDELRTERSDKVITQFFKAFPSYLWNKISEDARLRIENKLLQSIKSGSIEEVFYRNDYDDVASRVVITGSLGTWIIRILDQLLHKQELYDLLLEKLSHESAERAYVAEYFLASFPRIFNNTPITLPDELGLIVRKILEKRSDYLPRTQHAIDNSVRYLPKEWAVGFTEQSEQRAIDDDEDMPF